MHDYSAGELFYYITALFLIVGLMYLFAYLLRRFLPGAVPLSKLRGKDSKRLKIIENIPLSSNDRALILSCDHHEFLVILGQGGTAVLNPQTGKPVDELRTHPLDEYDQAENNKNHE